MKTVESIRNCLALSVLMPKKWSNEVWRKTLLTNISSNLVRWIAVWNDEQERNIDYIELLIPYNLEILFIPVSS